MSATSRCHALAETTAEYGSDASGSRSAKVSISLPIDLLDEVRAAASETGTTVSGVIAAALRRTMATWDQERIDAALEAQNAESIELAEAYLPTAAALWSKLEW
jgi:hypothetical protein